MEEITYECGKCGCKKKAPCPPECCGHKMSIMPLKPCTSAHGPEHSRPMEDDEPCDDSRGG